MEAEKRESDQGGPPEETFESGMGSAVSWSLNKESGWSNILEGGYRAERLGLAARQ